MELAYLCRGRYSEVMGLHSSHVGEDGLTVLRAKGSEGEITLWSERLRAAVSDVNGGEYICYRYSKSAFRSAWRRLQGKMESAGIEPFPFHDLKAKGISDHDQNFGGHRSQSMRQTYVRTLQEIPATR